MKTHSLLLTMALVLALLAGCTQSPAALETPSPADPSNPEAQPQAQFPASDQRGPGSFDLIDPAAGLAEMPRYEAVLKLNFTGTRDGQPYHVEKTFTLRLDRGQQTALLTQTGIQPDGTSTESFTGLLGAIRYSQGAPGQPCQAVRVSSDEMEFTPALMLPTLLGAEAAGEEIIDSFQTQIYSFDHRALGAGESAVASGKIWIAQPGGQVVKYILTLDSDTVFGAGIQGRQSWEYTLRDPGEGTVQLPENCPLPLTGIPVPDDASQLVQLPAGLEYQTGLDKNALAAFHADQLGALGYLPQAEVIETASGTTWSYLQQNGEGQTMLVITAAAVENGLSVRVIRIDMKP